MNLSNFIGQPVGALKDFFAEKGWVFYDSFNDYKWVWINKSNEESVIVFTELNDFEEVVSVETIDGIYHENHKPFYDIVYILLLEPRLNWIVNYCIRQNELAKENEIYFDEVWAFVKSKMYNLIGYHAECKSVANSDAWDFFHEYLLEITPNTK